MIHFPGNLFDSLSREFAAILGMYATPLQRGDLSVSFCMNVSYPQRRRSFGFVLYECFLSAEEEIRRLQDMMALEQRKDKQRDDLRDELQRIMLVKQDVLEDRDLVSTP